MPPKLTPEQIKELNRLLDKVEAARNAPKPVEKAPEPMSEPSKRAAQVVDILLEALKGDKGGEGKAGKDGNDGKDGKNGKQGERGVQGEKGVMGPIGRALFGPKGDKGDKGEDGKNGTVDDGILAEFRREIDALKKRPLESGGGIFATNRGRVVLYDLSAQLNGVLKTFALPTFWKVISVQASSFPHAFRPDVDYTTDGTLMTITFTSEIDVATALATGQTLTVTYAEP